MMKLSLAENIRIFRKQKKMTQEKLAEALGVTVGAVYKWESGLSQPELNMLVEMADFFDTSVDVLLGYRIKDNRLDAILERLHNYCQTMDPAGIAEAEKALVKYPHSFKAVFCSAEVYLVFGIARRDRDQLLRAMDLLERARVLLPQNDDPSISESQICAGLSNVWFLLGEQEKSLELLKKNNSDGMFSHLIGLYLAVFMNQPEEAAPYLSEALFTSIATLLNTIMAYYFTFRSRNDWDSAYAITSWGVSLLSGLRKDVQPDLTEKILAETQLLLAHAQLKTERSKESLESLHKAKDLMIHFDSMPEYSLRGVRFADYGDQTFAYDMLGLTVRESIRTLLDLLDDPEFTEKWKEVSGDEL